MSNVLSRNLYSPNATNGISGLVDGINGLKSFSDNSAAAAGYVGSYVTSTGTSVSAVNSQWVDVATITLAAGDWDVIAYHYMDINGTTMNPFTHQICVIPDSGNTGGSSVTGNNNMSVTPGNTFSGSPIVYISIPLVRVSSDGTNISVEGQSGGTSTQIVRLKAFMNGIVSGGPPKFTGSIKARLRR